jgi:hypothetical protein
MIDDSLAILTVSNIAFSSVILIPVSLLSAKYQFYLSTFLFLFFFKFILLIVLPSKTTHESILDRDVQAVYMWRALSILVVTFATVCVMVPSPSLSRSRSQAVMFFVFFWFVIPWQSPLTMTVMVVMLMNSLFQNSYPRTKEISTRVRSLSLWEAERG